MAEETLFERYIDRLIRLHELMAGAPPDADDMGDPLRDDMYDLRKEIGEEDMKWLDCLSGDLYMLCEEDMYHVVPEDKKEEWRKTLIDHVNKKEWFEALTYLHGSIGLPKWAVARYRGMAWAEKSPRVSMLFLKHANKLLGRPVNN